MRWDVIERWTGRSASEWLLCSWRDAMAREAPKPQFRFPFWGRACLFLFLFALYGLVGSRERPWADATPMYEVAEAIVYRGEINIPTRWPPGAPIGREGKFYALAPLLQSLVHVPGVYLRKQVEPYWIAEPRPLPAHLLVPLSAHVGPAALAALTALLFLGLCRREGISLSASVAATLALALGSILFVYARSPYSAALQTFCLMGFFGALWRALRRPGILAMVAACVWLGLVLNSKPVYGAMLPVLGVVVIWRLWGQWLRLALVCFAGLATLSPFFRFMGWYNDARWGEVTSTGYGVSAVVFSENPLIGLWGLFLSPGKSLFLYSPPLLFALLGWPLFFRRARSGFVAVWVITIPLLLVYSRFSFWSGDWAWGPRYVVPMVPLFLFPLGFAIDAISTQRMRVWRWVSRGALVAVLTGGLAVQALGSSLYWDHYIRIATYVGGQWLGVANSTGSISYAPANCGACYEEMHFHQSLPPFNPIVGHAWLVPHVLKEHTWQEAAEDAPWNAYTNLRPFIGEYERARLDWWYRDYHDHHRKVGETMVKVLASATAVGGLGFAVGCLVAWWRRRRTLQEARPAFIPGTTG